MNLGRRTPETISPEAWLTAGVGADAPLAGTETLLTVPETDAPLAGCRVALGGVAPRSQPASHRLAVPIPVSANSARRVSAAGSVTWRKVLAVVPQRLEVRLA